MAGSSDTSSQSGYREPLAICVAVAIAAHASALVWARARPALQRHLVVSAAEVSVEEERRAAVAPRPADPPAPVAEKPAPPPPPTRAQAALPPAAAEEPPVKGARGAAEEAADAVARAAKALTADDARAASIASGKDDGVTHGMVAAAGTGSAPTHDPRARIGGRPGGNGAGQGAPPPDPGPDRSRPARVLPAYADACDFPSGADNINDAVVTLIATVRPDGTASGVAVVTDPGHGFGAAARDCAFDLRYQAAWDRAGKPISGTTPPFPMRFHRQ